MTTWSINFWKLTSLGTPIQSNSSIHHPECVVPCKDTSHQSGRFCARSLASYFPRSSKDRSSWTFFIQVGYFKLPSVPWRCWLGGRKGIRPVKTEWWGAGTVVCLERGADLHMAQLMPWPLTVSHFSKIQVGFTFLVPAYLGSPRKGPLNGCASWVLAWHTWHNGAVDIPSAVSRWSLTVRFSKSCFLAGIRVQDQTPSVQGLHTPDNALLIWMMGN